MKILKNSKPNILVIGDLMIDHYLWGSCERISPEAPVQVVDIAKETTVLGGAGNVINNLKALGANVSVSSVIGDDSNEAPIIGDPDQELPPETDVKLTGLRNAYSHVTGKLGSGHRAAEAIRVAATRKGIALVENSGEDDSDREEAGDEAIEIGVDTADVFHFSVY